MPSLTSLLKENPTTDRKVVDWMTAGLHAFRESKELPQVDYPENQEDMEACARGIFARYTLVKKLSDHDLGLVLASLDGVLLEMVRQEKLSIIGYDESGRPVLALFRRRFADAAAR